MRSRESIIIDPLTTVTHKPFQGAVGVIHRGRQQKVRFQAYWHDGWDELQLRRPNSYPSEIDIDRALEIFFRPGERVIQFYPRQDHAADRYSITLWHPHSVDIPLPPGFGK